MVGEIDFVTATVGAAVWAACFCRSLRPWKKGSRRMVYMIMLASLGGSQPSP